VKLLRRQGVLVDSLRDAGWPEEAAPKAVRALSGPSVDWRKRVKTFGLKNLFFSVPGCKPSATSAAVKVANHFQVC
jgi:hypothetical protein